MWICNKCGEKIEDQFDSCWKCMTPKGNQPPAAATAPPEPPKWRVAYKSFRGTFATWDGLFSDATTFANELGPERIVNISHSADRGDGVVVVWYLTTEDSADQSSSSV